MEKNVLELNSTTYDADQLAELKKGMAAGLDISMYSNPEFMAIQMQEIRKGLEEKLPVEIYASPEYDWFQMNEIRRGLEDKLNIAAYAKPSISYEKMRQIRKGLQKGFDLSPFSGLDAGILRQLRKAINGGVHIVTFIKEGYDAEQLEQIRLALLSGVDISPYISKEFRGSSIQEMRIGLECGLDISCYAQISYGWQQMREIRYGLESRIDINEYINSLYSWQQMREIRLGLEAGLDVSVYKSFVYTDVDMRKKRKALLEEREQLEESRHLITTEITDEKCTIMLSDDNMSAFIRLCKYESVPYTVDEVEGWLRQKGIIYGISRDNIEHLLQHNLWEKQIQVAYGTEPIDGKDGWYEYFFNVSPSMAPTILEDGTADYKNVNWFELVKAGDKIAYYHDAEDGIEGCNVIGLKIPAHKGSEQKMLLGSGFHMDSDNRTYIATIDGRIELNEDRITITRMLIVDEVNRATGDIYFEGSVLVKGNVGYGSQITATDNIVVEGNVETAVIRADGNILIKGGMTGGGTGEIYAGKELHGKFFESTTIKAGDNIHANYCMNCNVCSEREILIAGNKGMIVGGIVQAAYGINVYNLGNRAGIKTIVKLGFEEINAERRCALYDELAQAEKELAIFCNSAAQYKKLYNAEARNTMERYLKIENAIYTEEKIIRKIKKDIEKLQEQSLKAPHPCVIVRGVVYEGTVIEIDKLKWMASTLSDVTIQKKDNKITVYRN